MTVQCHAMQTKVLSIIIMNTVFVSVEFTVPAEQFIVYDISQVTASLHSGSITILHQLFRRSVYFIIVGVNQHTDVSSFCPQLYRQQQLNTVSLTNSHFTPPPG